MLFSQKNAPAITRGRSAATSPKFAIAEVGQGRFNTHATKALLSATKLQPSQVEMLYIDYDEKTRKMVFTLDHTKIKGAKAEDGVKAKIGEKSGQLAFTISWICNQIGYNFKESGNQTFDLVGSKDGSSFSFTFPEGTLANNTIKRGPRKAKSDKVETPATPATPVTGDDIE